ncbi:MAG: hypothetical protein GY814_01790 [Gammaproteobacteria bacterium]|nr:hypothetical protein [Gammaproteobacteria bacterium]
MSAVTPTFNLIGPLICIFVIYIIISTRRVHQDYWQNLHRKSLLEERAKEAELLSITDPLTKICNRMFFDYQFDTV